ncbi:acyltransferase [Colletotrichum costaricense]|uniref:Acyltransferase n=1 Tax=Colletotrichum costaricense TaxID=1209916 RepID=A0AAJ0E606_9PEZI|nr:acyltransferase [Colletotrichum costaricense]KAK1534953.1 acyltransferase [Colletotrichum costaricense]
MSGDLESSLLKSQPSSPSSSSQASFSSSSSLDDLEYARLCQDDKVESFRIETLEVEDDIYLDDTFVVTRPLPPWLRYPKSLALALIPSFLHPVDPDATPRPLHPSAWLDGLRGLAAFFVVCHHWSLCTLTGEVRRGFMSDDTPLFLQIPILRLALSGLSNVCVFFVISGYALSYKPMKLIKQKKSAEFAVAAASSAFRRYIRLFLPTMITSLAVAGLAYFKLFELEPFPGPSVTMFRPPALDNVWDQLVGWWGHFSILSDPMAKNLERGRGFPYQPQLWTIPVEFDGSLIVFLAHVAFHRVRPSVRISFLVCLLIYNIHSGYWQFFLFLSGLLLAALRFYGDDEDTDNESNGYGWETLPHLSSPSYWRREGLRGFNAPISLIKSSKTYGISKKTLQIASFIGALWLLSFPEGSGSVAQTPGYRNLSWLTPARYGEGDGLWIPIAAVWLVFTIDQSQFIQQLFTGRVIQYLGRISYAIYLVHNCLIWLWGYHCVQFFSAITGTPLEANLSTSWGFVVFLSTCLYLPGVVCVADFVQRYVDVNAVKFAAWFEGKLIEKTK